MKPIELTEEHKSKLLKMCWKLFPEMHGLTIQNNGYLNYSESKKSIDYDDNIHWFEFCMTHLAEKILDNSYGDISTSELGYFSCGPIKEIHPVDYLYEEFKKLEKYER